MKIAEKLRLTQHRHILVAGSTETDKSTVQLTKTLVLGTWTFYLQLCVVMQVVPSIVPKGV